MAIGDRRAGATPARQYSNARSDPNAFGAGVGRAIQGLAGAVEDSASAALAIGDTINTRIEKSEGFTAEQAYLKHVGEQNRIQAERIRETQEDAAGITNQTEANLTAANEAFIQTLPERLREQYTVKLEGYSQNAITSAFNYEYTAGNAKFVKDVNVTMNEQAQEVLLGNMSGEEAIQNIEGLIAKSDLDEVAQRDLRDQAETFLLKAEYQKEIEYAVEFKGTVEPKTEGGPVAAGLMPHEVGILNGIASEESAGRYDVVYGGGKIENFDDHPRRYVTITSGPNKGKKSSAAGKYQFLASTWDATVREYNAQNPNSPVTDFRPESQDRIAIFYARKIYNRQLGAGEMTFDQVLTSGNRELIISMKDALHDGRGGWEAFRTMSDNKFANIVMGAKGIAGGGTGASGAPDIWENPRYSNLSFEDKNRLAALGARAVDTRNSEAAAAATAQQNAVTEATMMAAIAGQHTLADMQDLINSGQLPDSAAVSKWEGIVNKATGDKAEIARIGAALNSGGPLYPSDNKGLNLFLGDAGSQAVKNLDVDFAQQTLLPVVARSGFFPSDVGRDLASAMLSTNPEAREYATSILANAQAADEMVLERSSGIPENVKREIDFINALRGLYTPEEISQKLRESNDPANRAVLRELRKEGRELFQDNYTVDTAVAAFDSWSPGDAANAPLTLGQNALLKQDYETAFIEGYAVTQDESDAKAYADKLIKRNWGRTQIGGTTRLTKYPPEVFYQTLDGSHEWVDLQVREELGFTEDTTFQLIPDAQTDMEGKRYNAAEEKAGLNNASYQIAFINEQGLPEIVLNDEGLPRRFAAEVTPGMKNEMEAKSQIEGLRNRQKAIFQLSLTGGALPQSVHEELETITEQIGELEGLQPISKLQADKSRASKLNQLSTARSQLFRMPENSSSAINLRARIEALETELELN